MKKKTKTKKPTNKPIEIDGPQMAVALGTMMQLPALRLACNQKADGDGQLAVKVMDTLATAILLFGNISDALEAISEITNRASKNYPKGEEK